MTVTFNEITDTIIDGKAIAANSGNYFDVTNPATGELLTKVPDMSAVDCEVAIQSSKIAQKLWKKQTAKHRAEVLMKWYDLMMENAEHLAQVITLECGKSIIEARGEVNYGASFLKFYAEEATRIMGDIIPSPFNDRKLMTIKQPIGVTAAITPWNFPLAMITRKAAPAIAAGCSMVIKPAEATPLSAIEMARLATEAGLPDGLINIVTAEKGAEVGNVLCSSDVITKLSFTGSTQTGRILMQQCAPTIKKLSLELGGNAPFIVFEDADIDLAVKGALAGKYRNSGQTCVCVNRFFVHENVMDEFAEKLAAQVANLKVGNGLEDGVNQGPLISQAGLEKAQAHVADAVERGATLMTGGKAHDLGGTFFEPTLLKNVAKDAIIAKEEVFAPVAALFSFKDEEEVVERANDTEFGLASYFYTNDLSRIWRVSEGLDYGMVGVNEGIISSELIPFGGVKQSGLGREGGYQGLEDYLESKYICLGGLTL